ncbi:peptidoglycan DD-metalloendopeptidase family protein [Acetobacterium malicum]|uniref:peptidoglycan DD-metalloendopeptidase family protein n=1 Tax=Acetobacterium malicum TaxID=52692 RepID=UPI0035940DCB
MASATLRVGADISEFQKATKQMNDEMKTLDSAMKASASAAALADDKFKGLKDQQSLLADKVKIASEAVQTQKSYIDTLAEKQEKLKTKQSELSTKIAETTEKWEAAKAQYGKNSDEAKKLADDLGKLEKQQKNNDSAIDSNITKINAANKKLEDNKDKLNQTEKALKDVNKEVSSFKINELADNLGNASTKMKDLGGSLTAGITVPIAAALTGLGLLASKAIDNADGIQKMSDVTGISAERLQELQYAGNNLGVSLDTIAGAQAKLTKSMAAAIDGTGTQAEAFDTLKVSVTDTNGNLRDAKDVMNEAFSALNGVGNETERDALAMSIFGKSAMELNPMIKAGSDEMARLTEEARKVGAVLSNEDISAMDAFGDSMDAVKMAISAGFAKAFTELLPKLQELMPVIQDQIVPAIAGFAEGIADLILKFSNLPGPLQGLVGGAAGLAVAMGPLLMLFGGIAGGLSNILGLVGSSGLIGGMSGAAGATGGLSAAFTALTGPVGIAVAAVAAIGAVIAGAWQNSEIFRDSVGSAFESIKVTIQDAFARISEAMGPALASFQGFSADVTPILQQIGDFLGTYVVPIVKGFFENFINGFADVIVATAPFIEGLGNLLSFIGNFVGAVFAFFNGDWAAAWTFAQAAQQSFVDFIGNALEGMQNLFFLVFGNLATKIQETWTNVQTSTSEAWNAITSFLQTTLQSIHDNTIGKLTETATGMAQKWNEAKEDTQAKWEAIKQDLATKWNEIKQDVTTKVTDTAKQVADKWQEAKNDSSTKWGEIREDLKTKIGEIYTNTIEKAGSIFTDLQSKWDEIKTDTETKWDGIKGTIETAVKDLPEHLKGIGSAMMSKMAEGIAATINDVYTGVSTLVTDVIEKFKTGFGINSPSTVLRDIGQFMIQGLIKGLSGDSLMSFVNNIVDQIKATFSNGALNIGTIMATLGSSAMDFLSKIGINLGAGSVGLNGMFWGSPTGTSVSDENFAWDEDFGDRAGSVGSQYHEGLDFNDTVGAGSPLYSIQNGVVSSAGYNGGYGNQVVIDFGNGIAAAYSHLDSIAVEAGQAVSLGQIIGTVGNTGVIKITDQEQQPHYQWIPPQPLPRQTAHSRKR